jgi:hypothetical protein
MERPSRDHDEITIAEITQQRSDEEVAQAVTAPLEESRGCLQARPRAAGERETAEGELHRDQLVLDLLSSAEKPNAEAFTVSDHPMEATLVLDVLEEDPLAHGRPEISLRRQTRSFRKITQGEAAVITNFSLDGCLAADERARV